MDDHNIALLPYSIQRQVIPQQAPIQLAIAPIKNITNTVKAVQASVLGVAVTLIAWVCVRSFLLGADIISTFSALLIFYRGKYFFCTSETPAIAA